jgi:hypothetical protein
VDTIYPAGTDCHHREIGLHMKDVCDMPGFPWLVIDS